MPVFSSPRRAWLRPAVFALIGDGARARAFACSLALPAALLLPGHAAWAGLSLTDTTRLASEQAPALVAQQAAVDGAVAAQPAAATLPDPRLTVGIDNLPISGADTLSLSRDFMTMQRFGLMQEVPNRAKRAARAVGAQARIERERALLVAARLGVQQGAGLAWLGAYFAERRVAQLAELQRENDLLQATLGARIGAGKAMPAELTMARQEALALADRRDDLARDVAKARASLRRWVGERADEPLDGTPPVLGADAAEVRAGLHRHAEIAPYEAQRAMAEAEVGEAAAEAQGDWGWELVYSRRGPGYADMISFQLSMDIPWQRERRQQPAVSAKQKEVARIEAEREDLLRRHREEIDAQLAELAALNTQRARLADAGLALAAERITLALAAYEAGRADLGGVLVARREAVDTRLRLIDLDAQRAALGLRLTTLIAPDRPLITP
jgi:outer membrane protein TolC